MNFGIFLPSLFTVGNLCCGFYSIINTASGYFSVAAWLILLALVFDGVDGLIARTTKTTSFFGIELDSMADLVSFCVAPGVLVYFINLKFYGISGVLVSLFYVIFGAIRLALYNVKTYEAKSFIGYFEGLPTPAAGGIIASFVLVLELFDRYEQGITKKTIAVIMQKVPMIFNFLPVIVIILSILMVTKFRYMSFSRLGFTKRISLRLFLLLTVGILLVISYPENIIFIIFSIYVASGIIEYFMRMYDLRIKNRRQD